jgi:hypothetical protein
MDALRKSSRNKVWERVTMATEEEQEMNPLLSRAAAMLR